MPARPKRVSMRGRGADIFFGDYDAPSAPPLSAEDPAPAATEVAATAPVAADDPALGPSAAIDTPLPVPAAPVAGSDEGHRTATPPDEVPTDQASEQASRRLSKQASNKASKADAPAASPAGAALDPDVLGFLWENLVEQATLANTFRYTEQELDRLADVLYAITKRHRAKLTKQDIARLGLNAVLWDYRVRGDASLLGEFVRRRQRAR